MEYFGSIDQGTTSSRFIVFDSDHNQIAMHQVEIEQILPEPNFVEHNPNEIWESVVTCINEVAKKFDLSLLNSVGITNQRETTVAWQKSTGEPFYNAIVWQDTRTQNICNDISQVTSLATNFKNTGLPIATYFSLSKILWFIENVATVSEALNNDDVCFGTIDSWLLYKLTGNHLTDVTNASRTLLLNLKTLTWDNEILEHFNIPLTSLPKIQPSLSMFSSETEIFNNIPITSVLGDQQASLFGHKGFERGSIKNTYGTGCFVLINTGNEIITSDNGLLTTIAFQIDGEKPIYALEGSVAIAGASVQWLRDNLGIINQSSDIEKLALEVKNNGDVYFVPAFSGLFSPHWDPTARGIILGLSRFSNKSHISRAVLESVAHQTNELLSAFQNDLDIEISKLLVDGGMVENNLLMQFQSDISNIQIQSQSITEVTAFGAGLASYIYQKNIPLNKVSSTDTKENTWSPNMDQKNRQLYIQRWLKAVEKAKNWLD